MRIAISGDVASGKTTVAKALAKKLKLPLVELSKFVEEEGLAEGYDEELNSKIVDVERLKNSLEEKLPKNCIVEGHLLVEFKLSEAVLFLIDENSEVLYKRMKERGYNEAKIEQNLIAHHLNYFTEKAKEVWKHFYIVPRGSVEERVEYILKKVRGI